MKKIFTVLFLFFVSFNYTWAYFSSINIYFWISSFINSVNTSELLSIEDDNLRYCEQVFLKVYMRREFTQAENDLCRDIFTQKIESEMDYKKYILSNRGIY